MWSGKAIIKGGGCGGELPYGLFGLEMCLCERHVNVHVGYDHSRGFVSHQKLFITELVFEKYFG